MTEFETKLIEVLTEIKNAVVDVRDQGRLEITNEMLEVLKALGKSDAVKLLVEQLHQNH